MHVCLYCISVMHAHQLSRFTVLKLMTITKNPKKMARTTCLTKSLFLCSLLALLAINVYVTVDAQKSSKVSFVFHLAPNYIVSFIVYSVHNN